MNEYDIIIVGSGIAALQLARHLPSTKSILLVTKGQLRASNSYRAQGGIAAAIGRTDHPSKHKKDTLQAGCYFHREQAVEEVTDAAPELMQELIQDGVPFDTNGENIALGMEGAHSEKRIVHCGGDATGKFLIEHYLTKVPHLHYRTDHFVTEILKNELGQCCGVRTLNKRGQEELYYAQAVVLATGGMGQLFTYTSNDETVTGDGLALAIRAGADLVDLEFIQFHPTLLYKDGKSWGLISEAVRGEGAILRTSAGRAIMEDVHPLKDLAPRHLVSKAIYETRTMDQEEVYLDISMITHFREKFPTISTLCEKQGISLEKGRLPVAPGSHFLMGGIVVDEQSETTVPRLFAIGEAAYTGIHGANRLASNSLLEALHYGKRLASYMPLLSPISLLIREEQRPHQIPYLPTKQELQQKMMAGVGVIRDGKALQELSDWLEEFPEQPAIRGWTVNQIERQFMIEVARRIIKAALLRKESRGAHFRSDYTAAENEWAHLQIVHTGLTTYTRSLQNESIKVT